MKSILFAALATTGAATMLCACSNREVYDSLQGAKQNECNKVVDNNERQRCFEEANKNYDRYQREREAAQGK